MKNLPKVGDLIRHTDIGLAIVTKETVDQDDIFSEWRFTIEWINNTRDSDSFLAEDYDDSVVYDNELYHDYWVKVS